MSGWASQFVLGSTGLALTVLATALVLRAWRRLPVASYRLGVAVLAAALALPAAQLAARGLALPLDHPARGWVTALRQGQEQPGAVGEESAPERRPALPSTVAGPTSAAPAPAPPATLRFDPALLALVLLGQETEDGAPVGSTGGTEPLLPPTRARRMPWRTGLALVYVAGLALALGRTARRLLRTRALLRSASPVRDPRIRQVWREVARGSQVGRRTRLLESGLVRAPACYGLGRPAVVLPADEALARRRDVLACVLTHELVHLERRDGWVLLGEALLRALFWFHPAAWWLVARLERLREVSCDQLVVRRTGQRRRYAAALVEYAAWMQAGEDLLGARAGTAAAVVPWSGSKGQLTRRIEMLLTKDTPSSVRRRLVAPAAVGIAFTFLWSGQLALAAGDPAQDPHAHEPHAPHVVVHSGGTGHQEQDLTTIGQGARMHVDAEGRVVVETHGADAHEPVTLRADSLTMKPGQKILVQGEGRDARVISSGTLQRRGEAPIGIVIGEADETLAAQLGEKPDRLIVVRQVVPGSRAEKAGLRVHDVIVGVDGRHGGQAELLDAARTRLRNGRDIEVIVVRKGRRTPLVLRAGDGEEHDVWVEGGKDIWVENHAEVDQTSGSARVFGLGRGGKVRVIEGEDIGVDAGALHVFGLGDGPADEDDQSIEVHIETIVEDDEGETEKTTYRRQFGLGGDVTELGGSAHESEDEEGHEGKLRFDYRFGAGAGSGGSTTTLRSGEGGTVTVFGLTKDGGVTTLGEKSERASELDYSEQLGRTLRRRAQEYYREVDPEDFKRDMQRALDAYETTRKQYSEEDGKRIAEQLHYFAQQDAEKALEKARQALEQVSDEELAVRTAHARDWLDAARAEFDDQRAQDEWVDLSDAFRDRPAADRGRIEDLRSELEATRKQLDLQRQQIEELKNVVEQLKRERQRSSSARQLR